MYFIYIFLFSFPCSDAAEAEAREDYFYARTARRFGGAVRKNSVSGHIHARRGGAEDQSTGVPRTGEISRRSAIFEK